eukprot:scaffold27521_cov30-Tisochrysis_lutea.AAC.4
MKVAGASAYAGARELGARPAHRGLQRLLWAFLAASPGTCLPALALAHPHGAGRDASRHDSRSRGPCTMHAITSRAGATGQAARCQAASARGSGGGVVQGRGRGRGKAHRLSDGAQP